MLLAFVVIAIVLLVAFDFTNGFHDTSNMIATAVASRAMSPAQAVLLVGTFTFLGPLIGGTAVANTMGSFVDLSALGGRVALETILCGAAGAIGWNLITWWSGLPSSSTHALVGGLLGATLAVSDPHLIVWHGATSFFGGGVAKLVLVLMISPPVGFLGGFLVFRFAACVLGGRPRSTLRFVRRSHWLTTAGLSFAHGTNDAQKTMGIMTLVLVLGGELDRFAVPTWVALAASLAITSGTVLGGWRIVKTLGFGIYRLRPLHSLSTQLASSMVIFGVSAAGAPVSSNQVVGSAIAGVGAGDRPRHVHWGTMGSILASWLLTLPASGLLAYGIRWSSGLV